MLLSGRRNIFFHSNNISMCGDNLLLYMYDNWGEGLPNSVTYIPGMILTQYDTVFITDYVLDAPTMIALKSLSDSGAVIVFLNITQSRPLSDFDIGDVFYTNTRKMYSELVERYTHFRVRYSPHFMYTDIEYIQSVSLENISVCYPKEWNVITNIDSRHKLKTRYIDINATRNTDIVLCGSVFSVLKCIRECTLFVCTRSSETRDTEARLPIELRKLFIDAKLDSGGLPMSINNSQAIEYAIRNKDTLHKIMNDTRTCFNTVLGDVDDLFVNVLSVGKRLSPPVYKSQDDRMDMVHKALHTITRNPREYNRLLTRVPLKKTTESNRNVLEKIMYSITGDPDTTSFKDVNVFSKTKSIVDTVSEIVDWSLANRHPLAYNILNYSDWQHLLRDIKLILDTDTSKTFKTRFSFYKSNGIIPHQKEWVGVLNDTSILCIKEFVDSLPTCKHLVTYTRQIFNSVKDKSLKDKLVLIYPSVYIHSGFEWRSFETNQRKKLLYFKKDTVIISKETELELKEVQTDDYIPLLTNNIMYMNNVDEHVLYTCIVSNTPVFVKKCDISCELLGEDYPLYYSTYYEFMTLLHSPETIHEAYIHLLELDKNRFSNDTFIDTLNALVDNR